MIEPDTATMIAHATTDRLVRWNALAEIRDLIEDSDELNFTAPQRRAILSIFQNPLYEFDPAKNLRFRSSTNVEDGREFTGAGLYEGYRGCLADDLDGDSDGPCLCDPSRGKEWGVVTDTTFYWPPAPTGPTAGYTAPLARRVETRITGYTTEPLVLVGYYSQTYKPEHHNFTEHFLFEPGREPGLSSKVLAELEAKGIRQIHVLAGWDKPTITTYD